MRSVSFILLVAACGSRPPQTVRPSNVSDSSVAAASKAPPATPSPCAQTGEKAPPDYTVSGIAPTTGDAQGGTYVVVKGSNFIKSGPRQLKVCFGSKQGAVVRFQSDSEVIVQAPGGTVGESVDVVLLFDPGGQRTLASSFTFVDTPPATP